MKRNLITILCLSLALIFSGCTKQSSGSIEDKLNEKYQKEFSEVDTLADGTKVFKCAECDDFVFEAADDYDYFTQTLKLNELSKRVTEENPEKYVYITHKYLQEKDINLDIDDYFTDDTFSSLNPIILIVSPSMMTISEVKDLLQSDPFLKRATGGIIKVIKDSNTEWYKDYMTESLSAFYDDSPFEIASSLDNITSGKYKSFKIDGNTLEDNTIDLLPTKTMKEYENILLREKVELR